MINTSARNCTNLNGKWQVIIDPTGIGNWRQVWKENVPVKKTDFVYIRLKAGPPSMCREILILKCVN